MRLRPEKPAYDAHAQPPSVRIGSRIVCVRACPPHHPLGAPSVRRRGAGRTYTQNAERELNRDEGRRPRDEEMRHSTVFLWRSLAAATTKEMRRRVVARRRRGPVRARKPKEPAGREMADPTMEGSITMFPHMMTAPTASVRRASRSRVRGVRARPP
ncbi:hypothetical protein PHLGIDRAFT_446687 [Phlebiopsis gigantea 11061_1 CR5-6]|uniref:Uncharacterized protein n=1 Tax=Phlebiopsis gigantea (strain 11061_1 CR5-6) TaxID=745531 RepID=A0A0C3S7E5_PHLG1|nr:hypothetical protein PHLGIDRAFT_446687 [Phlebiopsis gigantea 11061_1 CR5-6]